MPVKKHKAPRTKQHARKTSPKAKRTLGSRSIGAKRQTIARGGKKSSSKPQAVLEIIETQIFEEPVLIETETEEILG